MTSNTAIAIPNGTLGLNNMKIEQDGQGWGYTTLSVRKHNSDNAIVLRSRSGSNDLYLKLDAKNWDQIEALRDLLNETLESKPTPLTKFEQQWPSVKIGDEFGFGLGARVGSYPYVKVSETEYSDHNGGYSAKVSELMGGDHARGIHWRTKPVHPTVEEQYNELPIGAQFKWRRRETGQEAANAYIKVPGGALPLGYARGEVWSTTDMFTFGRNVELVPVNLD